MSNENETAGAVAAPQSDLKRWGARAQNFAFFAALVWVLSWGVSFVMADPPEVLGSLRQALVLLVIAGWGVFGLTWLLERRSRS